MNVVARLLLLVPLAFCAAAHAQVTPDKVVELVPHLQLRAMNARMAALNHPTLDAFVFEDAINAAFKEIMPWMKNAAELPRVKARLASLETVVGSMLDVPHWEMHGALSAIARMENNAERQLYHRAFRVALYDQLLRTGDGRSPQSAFQVIGRREAGVWLLLNEGVKFKSRARREIKGRTYDVLNVLTADGTEQQVYFDLSLMQASAERQKNAHTPAPAALLPQSP
jgi:hypothetical protein